MSFAEYLVNKLKYINRYNLNKFNINKKCISVSHCSELEAILYVV